MSGRDMAGKDENRIFVGGLSWDVNERQLENAFSRFGKIIEAQGVDMVACVTAKIKLSNLAKGSGDMVLFLNQVSVVRGSLDSVPFMMGTWTHFLTA
ncbi:hypothetical protein Patl1_06022 [Pistacia atlantica]|uniref:Uncharacterized protein n=1 Tax=Pistacia atlantica TaxID=434234 RepID=A0ACC1BR02_9ROSI|nr:hypothetical protein Patl1_06022 [Pistacia atlantica]